MEMTIDDAIIHAKEVAERNKQQASEMTKNPFCAVDIEKIDNCVACAEEHEKLAEWLDELKFLQEQASAVYTEITGNLLSKPTYTADTIISVYRARQESLIDKKTACEDICNIVRDSFSGTDVSGVTDLIKEYFE